ncbi:MAG: HAD-IC family P-type ATPase, partial [Gemmatimonadota bacterium]
MSRNSAAATDQAGHATNPPSAAWHTLSAADVQAALETRAEGLSEAEAAGRLEAYGPNEVETERPTAWTLLLAHQFRDPLIYVLLIAAAVTIALRDYVDAGVIIAVVLINAVIGFTQEMRAREAIRGLARLSAPRAEVTREGRVHMRESRDLVPGDIVLLAAGACVPADIRLTLVHDLEIDESLLTGESRPARKHTAELEEESLVAGDQLDLAFSGTTVTRGRGRGIVVRTGGQTEIGRIAVAIRTQTTTVTPLQQKMQRFGRRVGVVIVALCAAVLVIGLLRGLSPSEIFLTAVALAVSAIPEGLPVVMTVTLAVGVSRMARRNAIIRALPAVETLGSATVIGSDKTGTLTRNAMTVRAIVAGGRIIELDADRGAFGLDADAAVRAVLEAGVIANEADAAAAERGEAFGDPTETALLTSSFRCGVAPTGVLLDNPQLDTRPFEPDLRYSASLNERDGTRTIYVKGAPEVVLQRCTHQLVDEGVIALDAARAREFTDQLGRRGLRVLAMARR